MPKSALPPNYVIGPDNQSWFMMLKKKVQIWLAAGPRVPSGFWKWRDIPITIFAIRGKGTWRFENTDGLKIKELDKPGFLPILMSIDGYYLSRIQPWCRWHISLNWPLFFNCHLIYKAKNVVKPPTYQSAFGITKMVTFGIGFKRDGDKFYIPTANFGGNFE